MKRQQYLDYAYGIADRVWRNYDASREKALHEGKLLLSTKGVVSNPFRFVGTVAPAEAMRYRQTHDTQYLERAKMYLLDVWRIYDEIDAYRRENNISVTNADFPTLDWMFDPEPYISTFNSIKGEAGFSEEENRQIETVVELSLKSIVKMPEYGPINRSMLRALNLVAAATSFPEHGNSDTWIKMGRHIFADSTDQWSMEDSPSYQSIWLYCFMKYNEYLPVVRIAENPIVKYYADMWARMVSPLGYIPDYGDSHLGEDWMHMAAVLEKCASMYQSGVLKFAVNRFAPAVLEIGTGNSDWALRFIRQLCDAYEWADQDLREQAPGFFSCGAGNGTVGKKQVFRNGWDKNDTYLLLNYRDEGCIDEIFSKSLPLTIPVKAEKTHHGHNDENALSMLTAGGNILLSESGYRNGTTRDCSYRSDYYHNKLIVRRGLNSEYSFFDHVLDYGEYNPVRTEKIFSYSFEETDCSRTRLYDERNAAVCDRTVYYFRKDDIFIVNDAVIPIEDGSFTVGPVYHAQTIEPSGDKCFALSNKEISMGPEMVRRQSDDVKLYVYFPVDGFYCETRNIDRAYREQMTVSQFFAGYSGGQFPLFFSTVLCPSDRGRPDFFESFACEKKPSGIGLQFYLNGKKYTIFDRYRYESKIEDLNVRPAYSYRAGREKVFDIETDAYSVVTIEENSAVYFSAVDFSTLLYKKKSLFEMEPIDHLQLDFLEPLKRTASWSNWDDRIQLPAT